MVPTVAVMGAGIGGLVSACLLAKAGCKVTVFEAQTGVGGKLRQVKLGRSSNVPGSGVTLDIGPTVLTMPDVFQEVFQACGEKLENFLSLQRASRVARHHWYGGQRLDLFTDLAASAQEVRTFSGEANAQGFVRFSRHCEQVSDFLSKAFVEKLSPSIPGMLSHALLQGTGCARALQAMWRMSPLKSLDQVLRLYFDDPRLLQLFGRYATYCGSSPYLSPATLMMIWHVERASLHHVQGGMFALALAFETLARSLGVSFRFNTSVTGLRIEALPKLQSKLSAIYLNDGTVFECNYAVSNLDQNALAGFVTQAGGQAYSNIGGEPAEPSFSAFTLALLAQTKGVELARHNIFFSSNPEREFRQLTQHSTVPTEPSIYLCAQARGDELGIEMGDARGNGQHAQGTSSGEPLFLIVNAPAQHAQLTQQQRQEEVALCSQVILRRLSRLGLDLQVLPGQMQAFHPQDYAQMFPTTGGALYGASAHGWRAAFKRPTALTAIHGLMQAGGSLHPGPGLPLAAISGRNAAQALLQQLHLTLKLNPVATLGGTLMPSVPISAMH